MKQSFKAILRHLPWLCLLLAVDAFAALLLWIADAQAFCSMTAVILLGTLLLFASVCAVLVRRQKKQEQAFADFLRNPDEYHEETLQKVVSLSQRASLDLLCSLLHDRQNAYLSLKMQADDYEEYVESWAHETKTPLSLLTLLLDNRREELPASVSFKLDYIRNRMQESVDQMLFYARLKGTKKDYLFEHIPIRTVIEDVLEDYKPLLQEKQFQIRLCLAEDLVYSDQRGLHFLLGQIISNSVKYCCQNPELHVSFFEKDSRSILSIKDNGIGVRDCDLPYIFEKGFTGDTGKNRKKATGMGLYLANEMAKELNLTLDVHSRWGKGFEMQISFPVVHSV